jgi:hypothetical protein
VKARTTLILIAFVAAFPLVAAYVAYYLWQPEKRMNHGDLITPTPLPAGPLKTLDGTAFDLAAMKGKWLLLQAAAGACDERCRNRLYTMRQVRIAQGKDMARVERVWLLTDEAPPASGLLVEYEGTLVVRAAGSPLLAALPAPRDRSAHLYVVDPMGNLMMRFPEDPSPQGIIKDLGRLLRPGRIGAG